MDIEKEAEMNFQRLARNIEQTIYEGMVKIGYLEGRSSQVYYDPKLLGFLLEENFDDIKEAQKVLDNFLIDIKKDLPDILIRQEKERFCFIIGKESMESIYQRNQEDSFLKNLVELMADRRGTLEQVIGVFENSGLDYEMKEVDNPEFSHIFQFKDKSYDEYNYCFFFDKMGSYYHRLLSFELVGDEEA